MASSLETSITKIKTLPDVKQRGIAALLGATVADAATRPLHWIYNQETLNKIIAGSNEPEFWPESKSPFYTIPLGWPSAYNDTALVTLASMNENNGNVDSKHICEKFKKHFGQGSSYGEALLRRKTVYDPVKKSEFPGPVEGPWIQKGMILFLENYEKELTGPLGDPNNKEFEGFCAALPIIAKHAGEPDMWVKAAEIALLLSSKAETTQLFHTVALMVDSFIMGNNDSMTQVKEEILYSNVRKLIDEVEEGKTQPYISTVAKFDKSCSLPGSFQGALLTMLHTSSFVDAVRLNITAGGCNCSRANVIGACFGAKYGIDGIPLDWLKKVKDIEGIAEMAINVVTTE